KSVIDGTVAEEGFEVTEIIRKRNPNKPSTEEVSAAKSKMRLTSVGGITINSNSAEMQIIRRSNEPEYIRYSNNLPYPTDSLINIKDGKHHFFFPHMLQVRYTKEASEPAYSRRELSYQETTMSLTNGASQLMPNGILVNPLSLLFEGYMGWEKVGNLLPVDYTPSVL
ncbi:MAG: hypothetical protein AAFO69_04025, partial [Bacteroidota bacterium]